MNVKCIYNPSYDIALKYVILDAVKVSTLDWIGIFRITSIKPSDFITFQYSKQENNSNSTLQIIFPSKISIANLIIVCLYAMCGYKLQKLLWHSSGYMTAERWLEVLKYNRLAYIVKKNRNKSKKLC